MTALSLVLLRWLFLTSCFSSFHCAGLSFTPVEISLGFLSLKVELKPIHAQIPIEYFAERYLVALPG